MKIHLGCGDFYKKGFINVDYYDDSVADKIMPCTKLDFNKNSVNMLEANYLLEHLSYIDCYKTIEEAYRVLKPNGIFIVKCPNYECIIRNWLMQNNEQKWKFKWFEKIWGGQWHAGQFHKIGFSPYRLTKILLRAGFRNIRPINKKSSKRNFDIIALHSRKYILNIKELREKYWSYANEFFEFGFRKESFFYLNKLHRLEPNNPMIYSKIGQVKLRGFLCGINTKVNLEKNLSELGNVFNYFIEAARLNTSDDFKKIVVRHMFFCGIHDGMNEKQNRSREIYKCFKKIYPYSDLIPAMKYFLKNRISLINLYEC